jgi:hypothetical protein
MFKKKSFYLKVKNDFYLSFFEKESGYEEKCVNGFWLVKHWDGNENKWRVDLYSDESFKKFKIGSAKFKGRVDEAKQIEEHWKSLRII